MLFCFFLISIMCKNHAILLSSSCNYPNYRHTTNALVFKEILEKNGFKETEIIYLISEDTTKDERNAKKGFICIEKEEFIKLENLKPSNITINEFMNILKCNHKKMIEVDESSNILIYLCGHGGDGFLKFMNREFLLADDLERGISSLVQRGVNKILLICDTCQASSLVKPIIEKKYKNVFIVSTSLLGEPSLSNHWNIKIGNFSIDNFPFMVYRNITKKDMEMSLQDFFRLFNYEELGSTLTYNFDVNETFLIKDFFKQNNNTELKKFKLKSN